MEVDKRMIGLDKSKMVVLKWQYLSKVAECVEIPQAGKVTLVNFYSISWAIRVTSEQLNLVCTALHSLKTILVLFNSKTVEVGANNEGYLEGKENG